MTDPIRQQAEALKLLNTIIAMLEHDASTETLVDAIESALRACAAEARQAWFPIETAPKDGTRVMLVVRDDLTIGRWDADKYARNPRPYWTSDREQVYGTRDARANQPSRWQPLPPPPARADAQE